MPDSGIPDGDVFTSAFFDTYVREQVVTTCTSGTRPTGVEGRVIYETDTNSMYVYNGSAWQGLATVMASWTPTLTASPTPPTLGSGSAVAGTISYTGKVAVASFSVLFGSSGVAAGSGTYTITGVPVNPAAGRASFASGRARLLDSSSSNVVWGDAVINDSGVISIRWSASWPSGAETQPTNTVPWTWAANDRIEGWVAYPVA